MALHQKNDQPTCHPTLRLRSPLSPSATSPARESHLWAEDTTLPAEGGRGAGSCGTKELDPREEAEAGATADMEMMREAACAPGDSGMGGAAVDAEEVRRAAAAVLVVERAVPGVALLGCGCVRPAGAALVLAAARGVLAAAEAVAEVVEGVRDRRVAPGATAVREGVRGRPTDVDEGVREGRWEDAPEVDPVEVRRAAAGAGLRVSDTEEAVREAGFVGDLGVGSGRVMYDVARVVERRCGLGLPSASVTFSRGTKTPWFSSQTKYCRPSTVPLCLPCVAIRNGQKWTRTVGTVRYEKKKTQLKRHIRTAGSLQR